MVLKLVCVPPRSGKWMLAVELLAGLTARPEEAGVKWGTVKQNTAAPSRQHDEGECN